MLTSNHLHVGITMKDWRTALSSWDIDDGTWLNPIPILTSGGYEIVIQIAEYQIMHQEFGSTYFVKVQVTL